MLFNPKANFEDTTSLKSEKGNNMDLKEYIKSLGIELTEEQTKKLEEDNQNLIPKTRFDEVNQKLKDSQTMLSERDKQLEDLKASATNNEELKNKIAALEADNKKANEEWTTKYEELNFASAFKGAASKLKVKDKFLTQMQTQIDRSKLEKQEDGTYKGLDDALNKIIEDYPEYVDTTADLSGAGHQAGGSGNVDIEKENSLRNAMGLPPIKED